MRFAACSATLLSLIAAPIYAAELAAAVHALVALPVAGLLVAIARQARLD